MELKGINYAVLLLAQVSTIIADGRGMIGLGKTMYDPTCAFACRSVIRSCPLLCTPTNKGENNETQHSAPVTPPECYTNDQAFLRTMAMCINVYCGESDRPSIPKIEAYWASHLASGTVRDFTWKPAVSYTEALRLAQIDEQNQTALAGNATKRDALTRRLRSRANLLPRHKDADRGVPESENDSDPMMGVKTSLPIIRPGYPLNTTSMVAKRDWLWHYTGNKSFEANEDGHTTYTIAVMLVALLAPVLMSLLRFIPCLNQSRTWLWLNSTLIMPPLWGKSHRTPVATYMGGAVIPTRVQAIYIGMISVLNTVFLVAPYVTLLPQSRFASLQELEINTIGNRAGVMAMGNMVALFVFSARNNVLLWLTDWSHDTFKLLHRWLGYWTIILTLIHSALLLVYKARFGGAAEEEESPAIRNWGIVATVCATLIFPTSLLVVRQRLYELFLRMHQFFVVFFLVGYYYHIRCRYGDNWGYEIWAFIAIGIWVSERLARLTRLVLTGFKTAIVSPVEGSNGEYLLVEIENTFGAGMTYLYFPTLSWRFWENHPFSVASSFSTQRAGKCNASPGKTLDDAEKGQAKPVPSVDSQTTLDAPTGKENAGKPYTGSEKSLDAAENGEAKSVRKVDSQTTLNIPPTEQPTTEIPTNECPAAKRPPKSMARVKVAMRQRSSMTARLAARVVAAAGPIRIPVLMEASYQPSAAKQVSQCTRLLCIAGGVGISDVLPILQQHGNRSARLCWAARGDSLESVYKDELDNLKQVGVEIDPYGSNRPQGNGRRMDINAIIKAELTEPCGPGHRGLIGVVVCGPAGMADDVRNKICELCKSGKVTQGVVLVDDAPSW